MIQLAISVPLPQNYKKVVGQNEGKTGKILILTLRDCPNSRNLLMRLRAA